MRLYWPEAYGEGIDCVGFNHAVMLLRKAVCDKITNVAAGANYRVYCNLPWYHDPRGLRREKLPILAYTMYESSRVPSGWIRFLNKHTAIVVVPSEWCKSVFLSSGLKRPIFVLPLGLDTDRLPDCSKQSHRGEPYRFLWQGVAYDPNGRKGVDVVVRAFQELKKEGKLAEEDELILKYRPYDKSLFVMDDVRTPSGLRYIQSDMPREKLLDLYRSVDCCVNPTHGEGFGLIPLEQMCMGKPVLVTDYSMDYVLEPYCIKLNFELKQSPVVWNHKHAYMSLNGLSYNLGGLQKDIKFLPKLLKMCNSRGRWDIFANMGNSIRSLQKRAGLFINPRRAPICLYQENPGVDAFVDVEDLKSKMMWCYNNRENAEDIGFMARNHVLKNWGLEKIVESFESFESWERSLHA